MVLQEQTANMQNYDVLSGEIRVLFSYNQIKGKQNHKKLKFIEIIHEAAGNPKHGPNLMCAFIWFNFRRTISQSICDQT